MEWIQGGICAPLGFEAAAAHCGVKTHNKAKRDVMVIKSEVMASAAALFTKNLVQAAPIAVTREHLADGHAQALVANSGLANACAPNGRAHAQTTCETAASLMGLDANDIIVASTGVIGQELNIDAITTGLPGIVDSLERSPQASDDAAHAIMTTDTHTKEVACSFEIAGATVRMGAIAKGSGMIHPNMGTMFCFVTTDAAISPELAREALMEANRTSFSRITVDGDTSTNDTFALMANGLAKNEPVTSKGSAYDEFVSALTELCQQIARQMAADGEGAHHLMTCTVTGAADEATAETLAKSVVGSTLTKAAIYGCDANWGRVLCALGYSGASFDPERVTMSFASSAGAIEVCRDGVGLAFDEDKAKKILEEPEVSINVSVGDGTGEATCWGCDITHEYISINGDYRS